MGDDEAVPSRAQQQRHLLPRWPPDWLIALLLAGGLVAYPVTGRESGLWWLLPGAVAATVQKIGGHVLAWRSDGVERAYVVESAAVCFYVVIAGTTIVMVLQALDVIAAFNAGWIVLGALFADTMVRDWRRNRYA